MQLLSIIVLYNCKLEDSKTLISLVNNYHENPLAFEKFKLIIYDNSLNYQSINITIPFQFEYIHDPSNKGLAAAYNYALNDAINESIGWLLLMDQDSCVPRDFIDTLMLNIAEIQNTNSVIAVVPKVRSKNKFISPARVFFGGARRPINMRHRGVYKYSVHPIGSGSVIRVSFLQNIEGFNELFWMDSLDRWLFHTIETMGGQVFVSDSIIDHELSTMDFDKFVSKTRYFNIMKYETIFMTTYKSRMEIYIYYLRLLKRCIYLFFTVSNKIYSKMTFQHLLSLFILRQK